MKIGLLWFDNTPKVDLADKVKKAADYYEKKYNQSPNLCYVHPSMLVGSNPSNGIEIRPNRSVLPNHLWLGLSDEQPNLEASHNSNPN